MSTERDIEVSTTDIAEEIRRGRLKAHAKHGDNSIEATPADDAGWLAILGEELGEMTDEVLAGVLASQFGRIAHAMTYDADQAKLRGELIDLLTVGTAWVAAIDRASIASYRDGLGEVRDLTPAGIFRGLAVYFDQSNGTVRWQDSQLAQMMAEEATKLEREATERYVIAPWPTGENWAIEDTNRLRFSIQPTQAEAKAELQRLVAGAISVGDLDWLTADQGAQLKAPSVAEPVWPFNVQRRQLGSGEPAWGIWDAEHPELFAALASRDAAYSVEKRMHADARDGMNPRVGLQWDTGYLELVGEQVAAPAEPSPNPRYLVAYRARAEGSKHFPGVYDEATGRFYSCGSAERAEQIRDDLEAGKPEITGGRPGAVSIPVERMNWSAPGEWPVSEVEEAEARRWGDLQVQYRYRKGEGGSWGIHRSRDDRFLPASSERAATELATRLRAGESGLGVVWSTEGEWAR